MKTFFLLSISLFLTLYSENTYAQIVIQDEQLASYIEYRLETFGVPKDRSIVNIIDLRRNETSTFSIFSINKKIFAANSISQVLRHEKLKDYKSLSYLFTKDENEAAVLSQATSNEDFKKNLTRLDNPIKTAIDKVINAKYQNYTNIIYIE